ncbi:hypothetical protein DFP74_4885 [Nocardiopsis sp. Huas11]|uniref:spore-associated protein A n=1 Tax=Nocardiopsis sp. Huas11 TaxID=2183912 RepID=UPI000EB088F1|nr:spore-associated protein A [Nocardiopsis sp. Huas11]RKS09156.1 hypothetical protein DFP74_4885 [Nocardiopsis sp. Huas11]
MKKLTTKAAAVAAAAAIAVSGVLVSASPAAAATYGGECGSGYKVVNEDNVGSKGTVYLTYNSSTGRNCVVTKRHSPGSAVVIEAGLSVSPAGNHWAAYEGGSFTSYAGPVYLNAAGKCVDWMGRIGGTEGGERGTNCG